MAYDWTFQGRSEMVRCSLDTLAICSVMPKVQLSFCDKIRLYDETNIGIHIILSAAEGEIVQVRTVMGIPSCVRFCRQEFGEFPRLVDRYCSYLLPKQAGGTPQILVD